MLPWCEATLKRRAFLPQTPEPSWGERGSGFFPPPGRFAGVRHMAAALRGAGAMPARPPWPRLPSGWCLDAATGPAQAGVAAAAPPAARPAPSQEGV